MAFDFAGATRQPGEIGEIFKQRDVRDLGAGGGDRPPPQSKEAIRAQFDSMYAQYLLAEGQDRRDYRDIVIHLRDEYIAAGGDPHDLEVAPEQQNTTPPPKKPTYEELLSFYHQKYPGGIPSAAGGGKRSGFVIRPESLSPEALQAIYELEDQIDQDNGDEEPFEETINPFNAGTRGPTPEQIANMRALQDEQKRKRQEEQAQRQADRLELIRAQRDSEDAREKARQGRADQARQETLLDRANALAAKRQADREAARVRRQQLIANTAQRAINTATQTSIRVGSLPQPGGIGLLLVTIFTLLFAIVPMNHNGQTRLQLLAFALIGKVELPTSKKSSLDPGNMTASGSVQSVLAQAANQARQAIGQAAGNTLSSTANAPQTGLAGAGSAGSALQVGAGLTGATLTPFASGAHEGIQISIPFASLLGG
jgi:hypothetical protein